MTWTDLSRRAATVVLVALCLLAVPAVASAKFSSSRPAGGLSVGTGQMSTPTSIAGGYTCTFKLFGNESFSATVNNFTDTGPAGASYIYTLKLGSTVKDTETTTAKTATLSWSGTYSGTTTWSISIQSTLHRWTGGIGSETIVSCPTLSSKSGSF